MNDTECEGCYKKMISGCALFFRNQILNIPHVNKKPKNCPCMICLVKVICNNACDDHCTFWQKEYDRLYKIEV